MAKAARIDNVILHANGSVEIQKSEGDTPLPETPMGLGVIYPSKADLLAACTALESDMISQGYLALLQVAAGVKKDPNMGATFVSQTKNKTATLDLVCERLDVVGLPGGPPMLKLVI